MEQGEDSTIIAGDIYLQPCTDFGWRRGQLSRGGRAVARRACYFEYVC